MILGFFIEEPYGKNEEPKNTVPLSLAVFAYNASKTNKVSHMYNKTT